MSFTFTGAHTRPGATAGEMRFNTTIHQMEVFDGASWQIMSAGDIAKELTMKEMVEQFEDNIAMTIEEEYADNATIQDAYKAWEEANERFKVILAIAEKK